MANHPLTSNFNYFFGRLNPSSTFEKKASEHYSAVKALIEDRRGLAGELSPVCFLQGSYRHETATYTINDVDIVALCQLWQPGPGNGGRSYDRDEIFDTVAAPLLNDWRYKDTVRYNGQSMCIKLDTEPRIEILPVVFKSGTYDDSSEPFRCSGQRIISGRTVTPATTRVGLAGRIRRARHRLTSYRQSRC